MRRERNVGMTEVFGRDALKLLSEVSAKLNVTHSTEISSLDDETFADFKDDFSC